MSEKKKVQQQEETKGTVIYLGPEIPGIVSAGAVFKNGLTAKMEETVKEFPAVKTLLVPVKDVVKKKKNLNRELSAERICYEKIAEYATRKGV